ncbi:MAG: hypothetical protein WDZ73_01445 [Candidatus Paceibacterota bacterium]
MPMTIERQREIALSMVQRAVAKKILKGEETSQEMEKEAKKLGLTVEEFRDFRKALLPGIILYIMGAKRVSVTIDEVTYTTDRVKVDRVL